MPLFSKFYGQTTSSFAPFLLKKSETKTGLLTSILLTELKKYLQLPFKKTLKAQIAAYEM
jgi:hypothetical protein